MSTGAQRDVSQLFRQAFVISSLSFSSITFKTIDKRLNQEIVNFRSFSYLKSTATLPPRCHSRHFNIGRNMAAHQSAPGILSKIKTELRNVVLDIAALPVARKHLIWLPIIFFSISVAGPPDFRTDDQRSFVWQQWFWSFVFVAWTAHTHMIGEREGRAFTLWTLMKLSESEREEKIAELWKKYGWRDSQRDLREAERLAKKLAVEKQNLGEV